MAKKTNKRLRAFEGPAAELQEIINEKQKQADAATETPADDAGVKRIPSYQELEAEEAAEAAETEAKAAAPATLTKKVTVVVVEEKTQLSDDDAAKTAAKVAADKLAAEDAMLAEAAGTSKPAPETVKPAKKRAAPRKKVEEPVAANPEVHVSVAAWRYFRPKLKASGRYFVAGLAAGAKGFWKDSVWVYRKFWKARPVAAVDVNDMTDEEVEAELDALVDAEIVRRQLEDNLRADMAAGAAEDVRASAPRVRRTGPRRPGDRIQLDSVEDIDKDVTDIEESMMPAETPVVEKKLTMRERFTGRAKVG